VNMPGQILIRAEVWDDIRKLGDYFAGLGTIGREEFSRLVLATIHDLGEMPGIGSIKLYRSRRLEGIRSWSVRDFRKILVLYRQVADGIEVVGVMHGSRNIRAHLMRRLRKPRQ